MELAIDGGIVGDARRLASAIVDPVETFIGAHSTVAVERAVARLLDVDGTRGDEVPLSNLFLDRLGLERRRSGSAAWLGALVAETGRSPREVAVEVAAGRLPIETADGVPKEAARAALEPHVRHGLERVAARRDERQRLLARLPQGPAPLLYVIVASGNIYEDRTAAVAAAEAGAQIIAVIRSTGQSLLDYVP